MPKQNRHWMGLEWKKCPVSIGHDQWPLFPHRNPFQIVQWAKFQIFSSNLLMMMSSHQFEIRLNLCPNCRFDCNYQKRMWVNTCNSYV